MDNSFLTYLEQLEFVAFFSGFPLIYSFVLVLPGKKDRLMQAPGKRSFLLPFSYALLGTLFLGFQLRKLYPDYSIAHIERSFHLPLLLIWGLSSMLFWIPVMGKKPVYSLLHSLVFFGIVLKDLFLQVTGIVSDRNIFQNDMKLYTNSILLNAGCFLVTLLIFHLCRRFRKT